MGKKIRQWILIWFQLNFLTIDPLIKQQATFSLKWYVVKNPITPMDLDPLPATNHVSKNVKKRAKSIKKLHEQVQNIIIKQNERHKKNANRKRKSHGV